MSTSDDASVTITRVNLRGFSKDAAELVREMEDFGWHFRKSNHGVVGRAPDGKATASVGRTCARSNRAFQNAAASLKRWLRTNRPDVLAAVQMLEDSRLDIKTLEKTDPITAEVLQRKLTLRTIETMGELTDPAVSDRIRRTLTEDADPTLEHEISIPTPTPTPTETEETIVARKPYITTSQPLKPPKSKDSVTRVIERVWSTGRTDYQCALEGCPVVSSNPRSVSQHFGSAHTMAGKQHLAEPEPTNSMVITDAAAADIEPFVAPEPEPDVAVTNAVIIDSIQRLVSPWLFKQIDTLTGDVERITKERDEARDHLSKIQQDLDALRSLVAGIGSM